MGNGPSDSSNYLSPQAQTLQGKIDQADNNLQRQNVNNAINGVSTRLQTGVAQTLFKTNNHPMDAAPVGVIAFTSARSDGKMQESQGAMRYHREQTGGSVKLVDVVNADPMVLPLLTSGGIDVGRQDSARINHDSLAVSPMWQNVPGSQMKGLGL